MTRILGIFRELLHSPHRESDDALILKAVLEELSRKGAEVSALSPENLGKVSWKEWGAVLPMCESHSTLLRLTEQERLGRNLFINPPSSVLNCYRTRMIPLLSARPDISFPPTTLLEVRRPCGKGLWRGPRSAYWVKRGDVHNTCDRDVVFISNAAEYEAVRRDFLRRSISHCILQRHVPGDLIKYYGVGPGRWFTWFYHNPKTAERHAFDPAALDRMTQTAARVLGLEVYGGDAIITPKGAVTLIDVNSWPSFARVREAARKEIAEHIFGRIAGAKEGEAAPAAREAAA